MAVYHGGGAWLSLAPASASSIARQLARMQREMRRVLDDMAAQDQRPRPRKKAAPRKKRAPKPPPVLAPKSRAFDLDD